MNTEMIQNLLYKKSVKEVKKTLSSCTDNTILHVYAFNYNWNNGFDLPQAIIDNPACTLGTALMVFYLADGYRYLIEKNESSDIPEWLSFISNLYKHIIDGKYNDKSIAFTVPLSKVQIFKLKKHLNENEMVFVSSVNSV